MRLMRRPIQGFENYGRGECLGQHPWWGLRVPGINQDEWDAGPAVALKLSGDHRIFFRVIPEEHGRVQFLEFVRD